MGKSTLFTPKTCLFCGKELKPRSVDSMAESTDEHIFPKWLQGYLHLENLPVNPIIVRSTDLKTIDERRHSFQAFKAGGVCRGCNGGWMSNLENQVKPILIALIERTRDFHTLTDAERFIVARWTLKTAASLNRSSSYGKETYEHARVVPHDHLRALANGEMPEDVIVVGTIYQFRRKRADFLQHATWANPQNSIPLRAEDRNTSYKIGLSFGQLILIAAYYPSPDYHYSINSHGLFPIWSKRRVVPINHIWQDQPGQSLSFEIEVAMHNLTLVSHIWQKLVDNVAFTSLTDPLNLRFRA